MNFMEKMRAVAWFLAFMTFFWSFVYALWKWLIDGGTELGLRMGLFLMLTIFLTVATYSRKEEAGNEHEGS